MADDDTGPLCNSNSNNKNHLQLALEQPTKYGDDIEAGGTFPDTDEEHFDDEEEKGSDEEEPVEEEELKETSPSNKIPVMYQVEPGCTPLSCYSAILTFIVMTAGVFWLLLISPPKNSVPVPVPVTITEDGLQIYDFPDSYDDVLSSSTKSPIISATIGARTTGVNPPLSTTVPDLKILNLVDISKHIVDDSGT